jgi:hypothetical protein
MPYNVSVATCLLLEMVLSDGIAPLHGGPRSRDLRSLRRSGTYVLERSGSTRGRRLYRCTRARRSDGAKFTSVLDDRLGAGRGGGVRDVAALVPGVGERQLRKPMISSMVALAVAGGGRPQLYWRRFTFVGRVVGESQASGRLPTTHAPRSFDHVWPRARGHQSATARRAVCGGRIPHHDNCVLRLGAAHIQELLRLAELSNLLELLRRQLPWQIAACDFRRVHLVTDRLDDLRIGEGRETAAASATSSTVRQADSSSFVPGLWPATLMTSSTRPRIRNQARAAGYLPD